MDNKETAAAYTAAILDQLNAEIGASDHTPKSLARALEMDYGTFLRYTKGERPMPMIVLWQAVSALGVPQLVFAQRAQERFETQAGL